VPLSVSLGRKVINSNVCVYHKVLRLSVVLQKYSWCAVVWPFRINAWTCGSLVLDILSGKNLFPAVDKF